MGTVIKDLTNFAEKDPDQEKRSAALPDASQSVEDLPTLCLSIGGLGN